MLVREGLAKVDDYSNSKELWTAQEEAQAARRNVRPSRPHLLDADTVLTASPLRASADLVHVRPGAGCRQRRRRASSSAAAKGPAQKRTEYLDVVVSEVRGGTETVPFSFSVQVVEDGGIPALEKLMGDLTLFHREADVTPAGFAPRSGDLVSAKFSVDDAWYRAKVRRSNPAKKEAEVVYIDCALAVSPSVLSVWAGVPTLTRSMPTDGNTEVIPYSRLRPLAAQFKALEGQAKDATLSFVSLLDWRVETYGEEAKERFIELCLGQQLVANVDDRQPNGVLSLSLFDPADPNSLASAGNSLNVQLVREGSPASTAARASATLPRGVQGARARKGQGAQVARRVLRARRRASGTLSLSPLSEPGIAELTLGLPCRSSRTTRSLVAVAPTKPPTPLPIRLLSRAFLAPSLPQSISQHLLLPTHPPTSSITRLFRTSRSQKHRTRAVLDCGRARRLSSLSLSHSLSHCLSLAVVGCCAAFTWSSRSYCCAVRRRTAQKESA